MTEHSGYIRLSKMLEMVDHSPRQEPHPEEFSEQELRGAGGIEALVSFRDLVQAMERAGLNLDQVHEVLGTIFVRRGVSDEERRKHGGYMR